MPNATRSRPLPRASHRRRVETLALATLGGAVVVVGVLLAIAAVSAKRERERDIERAVRDYASFFTASTLNYAEWEIRRTLRARLLVRARLAGLYDGRDVDANGWLAASPGVDACRCVPRLPELVHLRTDAPNDSIAFRADTALGARLRPWIAQVIRDSIGLARDTASRGDGALETFSPAAHAGYAVALYWRRGTGGATQIYGYVADIRPIARIAFDEYIGRVPLFPGTLGFRGPNSALVRFVVESGHDTLYASAASPARDTGSATIVRTQHSEFGGVDVSVVATAASLPLVTPGARGGIVIPALAATFILLLSLAAIAVAAIRRREAAVRARGAFVASVSHELRTPLAQILLYAEQARQDLPAAGNATERVQYALDVIARETERLAHLADNAIHVAAGAERGRRLRRVSVDLPTVVEDAVERYRPIADDAGIAIEVHAPDDVPAVADAGAITQIVLNLLDNAVRHATGTRAIRIDVVRSGADATIAVSDDGPGVPDAERDRIWQPFARGAAADAAGVSGTGIGLAVVHDLVLGHGGRVSVETSSSGGARFVVTLPLEPRPASTAQPRTPTPVDA